MEVHQKKRKNMIFLPVIEIPQYFIAYYAKEFIRNQNNVCKNLAEKKATNVTKLIFTIFKYLQRTSIFTILTFIFAVSFFTLLSMSSINMPFNISNISQKIKLPFLNNIIVKTISITLFGLLFSKYLTITILEIFEGIIKTTSCVRKLSKKEKEK